MAVTTVEPGSTVVVVVVVDVVRRGRGEGDMSKGVDTVSGSGAGDPWGNTVWDVTTEWVELAMALVVLFEVLFAAFLVRAVGVTITSCRRGKRRGGGGGGREEDWYTYLHVCRCTCTRIADVGKLSKTSLLWTAGVISNHLMKSHYIKRAKLEAQIQSCTTKHCIPHCHVTDGACTLIQISTPI